MKIVNGFTRWQLLGLGMLTEMILVAIQFIYHFAYTASHPETDGAFGPHYMKDRGFYTFQVVGFFLYVLVIYFLLQRIRHRLMSSILTFLVGGAVIEMIFYLAMGADFEGAFLYSILDKAMAAAFATILFFYAGEKVKHV